MDSLLSRREVEVLQLMVEGLTDSEIALRLALSPNTVKKHVMNILATLDARNRTRAAVIGVVQGIVNSGL